MRIELNKLTVKIFIYNNVAILLLCLCLHIIIPSRFEAYIIKEKEASLKHLHQMLTQQSGYYFYYSKDKKSGSYTRSAEVVKNEIMSYFQVNPDFTGFALVPIELDRDEKKQEPFRHNMHITPKVRDLLVRETAEIRIFNEAGRLKVITPVFTERGGKKIKRGFLLSEFNLKDQENEIKRVRYAILLIWGLFITVGNLLGYYQSRFIAISLRKSSALIKDVVQGDLRGMIQSDSRDELGSLIHSLNDMVKTWREKMGDIKTIVKSSNAVSTEISIAASQQEKTTSNQASSINQVATTIEELNATSKIVHEKAEVVEGKSLELLQVSLDGQKSVNRSIETFASIRENVENIAEYVLNLSEEAQQIGIILKEVSAIVSQTDMLAINAGIRAARVKEKGKQFTIIATELTDLANQSQESADKVSSLIQKIQNSNQSTVIAMDQAIERVEGGIKFILKAGKTIETSIRNVNETVDSVKGIALSSHQQSLGTNQVAQSVVSINAGMQETAISSKQTLEETKNLQEVNQELLRMISFYKF